MKEERSAFSVQRSAFSVQAGILTPLRATYTFRTALRKTVKVVAEYKEPLRVCFCVKCGSTEERVERCAAVNGHWSPCKAPDVAVRSPLRLKEET